MPNSSATCSQPTDSQTLNQALASYFTALTEPQSRAMAAQITYQPIQTPLVVAPIQTAVALAAGRGNPILLLHGFDSSLLEYRRLWPQLVGQHPLWAIDLLGFGFTERPQDCPFSAAAIQTHLHHAWQQLINEPVTLIAASMGGAAALEFSLAYPELVQKLILIDSAGVQPGPPGQLLVPPLGWLATEFLRSPKVRQNISRNAYHDPSYATADALACAASHLQVPGWRDALIRFTKSGGYHSLEKQLSTLQVPTLILWGESDRILGTKDAAKLQRAIPHSQLTWIPEAGHVPHLEKPELTAQLIRDWLAAD